MKINLESLIVLDTIDRYGSFTLAAEKLYRVRSALTYTIKKLEQDLDVQLLDRSGHKAKLTPEGKVLLKQGRQLLQLANEIEKNVKRMSTGWEEKITIAVDDTISTEKLFPLIQIFYQECPQVNLQITAEILSGCWDALLSGRADLAIGVSGDNPLSSEFGMISLGEMKFVFALSPTHPLAHLMEPLTNADIVNHRSIVVADTSQGLTPRSTGTLIGQSILTVSNMAAKIKAQIDGLGVGYLPEHLIKNEVLSGKLVIKSVEKAKPRAHFSIAWRLQSVGHGLKWFLSQLKDPKICKSLLM